MIPLLSVRRPCPWYSSNDDDNDDNDDDDNDDDDNDDNLHKIYPRIEFRQALLIHPDHAEDHFWSHPDIHVDDDDDDSNDDEVDNNFTLYTAPSVHIYLPRPLYISLSKVPS